MGLNIIGSKVDVNKNAFFIHILGMQVCLQNQFTCNNKQCIATSKTCDGVNDCGDYSDEILPCSGITYYILIRIDILSTYYLSI